MEFVLKHPRDNTHAIYGFDPERGVWTEVPWCGIVAIYDVSTEVYDTEDPILGLLLYLAMFEYVAVNDIEDAVNGFARPTGCRRRRPRRWGLRTALQIIENLERAGG